MRKVRFNISHLWIKVLGNISAIDEFHKMVVKQNVVATILNPKNLRVILTFCGVVNSFIV